MTRRPRRRSNHFCERIKHRQEGALQAGSGLRVGLILFSRSERAESIEYISFRYKLRCEQFGGKPYNFVDDSVIDPFLLKKIFGAREPSEGETQWNKNHIQISALQVLRIMKAYKAIPDLEKILSTTTDEHLI